MRFHCQMHFCRVAEVNIQNLKISDAYLSVATNSFFFNKFKNNHDMVAVNMEFDLECSFYFTRDMS